ncbi:NUDIX domain-containing protein [Ruminococcus albus]|uniref:8-oxo-dGTP diphosphatase n=1 Tax=Ruminococcus albus TaxID=1264 RepID=A0A1I1HL67_RUMAL|nr:NUDIX domain-containing protein [Ruminococcus albus]SFC22193.1 8-oxo-dGTP diphosphatase [Ruminococcus albus]
MKTKSDSYICKDYDGNIFISFEQLDEIVLSKDPLLTHCLAVVKIGDDYLLGWNKWRNRYEIFGGCIEKGETARDCIIRECNEELGLVSFDVIYLGAMKFLMKPDYFSPNERIELGGLYGIRLYDINIDNIYEIIKDKEEITKLALYSQVRNKEPIALIDEKLLEYFV